MMRCIFLILLLTFKISFSQIPNSSFENWNNGNPVYWQTTNIPIVPASVVMDSNAYEGFLAVKGMVVSDIRNKPFAPYLGIYGSSAQGFPIDQPYEFLSGWCRLFLKPGDRFTGDIKFYDSNQEPMAQGNIVLDSTFESWIPFKMKINYYGLLPPVSCSMFFTITDSSLLASGHIGSFFVLDEMTLEGNVGINSFTNQESTVVYPNPARSEIHILNKFPSKGFNYSLHDATGRVVLIKEQCFGDETLNVEMLLPGVYFLNCLSDENRFVNKVIIE
jgi:hypothetical protein